MNYDITIGGGGILGCSVAYWLSGMYKANILVLEKNGEVGKEQSTRNTGTLHRPFYLDPQKRKKFAIAANWGFDLWGKIAHEDGLEWKQGGTLELAVRHDEIATLQEYQRWAHENGMDESEVRMYSDEEVASLEPNITAAGALLCKTDTSVNFGSFTQAMKKRAEKNGVNFKYESEIEGINQGRHVTIYLKGREQIETGRFINTAGNFAVNLAHLCGEGMNYTDLNFRGDYWKVDPEFGKHFPWNVYTVPNHPKYQFLDPHLIVRSDGTFDIGPSALFVPTPQSYVDPGTFFQMFSLSNIGKYKRKMLEEPFTNKLKLFSSKEFLLLALGELMHMTKDSMVRRMKSFIPTITPNQIIGKGISGIRSSVVNERGEFEPEAILLDNDLTFHVLAYNSPGASGAPGFAAYMVGEMQRAGLLDELTVNKRKQLADIEEIIASFRNLGL